MLAILAMIALIAAVTGILWLIQFVLGNEESRGGEQN